MTVTYTAAVATCTGLGCFWKLLFRWKGSIYKLLWPNLLLYSVVYTFLSLLYRFVFDDEERVYFEKLAIHCQKYGDLIQIQFILGFYVGIVIKRWWDQYTIMPWPDRCAMFISTLVHGQDERGRLIRRTLIRFVNLSSVLVFRMMSPGIKKRFPTLGHLIDAGLLQPEEKKIFEDLDLKCKHPKYWMPLIWCGGIITKARKEGRIRDDYSMKTLIDELNAFRGGCGGMLNYDWITIPLVYTQVVTLAVYIYFASMLMGSQELSPSAQTDHIVRQNIDLVIPIFTLLQFFFYMGWLKVAESLVNPWGDDDDDFDLNWLVDRNLQVSYVIVDEMHQEHPEMMKDQYWDEIFPVELPYTAGTKQYQGGAPPVSTDALEVSSKDARFLPLDTVDEESNHVIRGYGNNETDFMKDQSIYNITMDAQNSVFRQETNPVTISNWDDEAVDTGSEAQVTTPGKKTITNLWKRVVQTSSGKAVSSNVSTHSSSESIQSRLASLSQENVSPQRANNGSRDPDNPQGNKDDLIFQMSNTSILHPRHRREQEEEQVTKVHHPQKQAMETDLKPVDLSVPDDDDGSARLVQSAAIAKESWGGLSYKKERSDSHSSDRPVEPNSPPTVHLSPQVPLESNRNPTRAQRHFSKAVEDSSSPTKHVEVDHVIVDISLSQLSTLSLDEFRPSNTLISIFSLDTLAHEHEVTPITYDTVAGTTTNIVTNTPSVSQSSTSQTITKPLSSSTIIEMPSNEPPVNKTSKDSDHLKRGISSPFIPSAAIPVPAVSPAHATSSRVGTELEMVEEEKLARQIFFDLKPINEQSENLEEKERKEGENETKKDNESNENKKDDESTGNEKDDESNESETVDESNDNESNENVKQ